MKFPTLLNLALAVAIAPVVSHAQPEKNTCQHHYMCPGVAIVTVSEVTAAEQDALKLAQDKVSAALKEQEDLKRSIIVAHEGYVFPACGQFACYMASGAREDDEAEWKLPYLILTKRWVPEL